MAISLRGEHLKRYVGIGRLLVKYGRSDLVRDAGMEESLREEGDAPPGGAAARRRGRRAGRRPGAAGPHLHQAGPAPFHPRRPAPRAVRGGARPAPGRRGAVPVRRGGAHRHGRAGRAHVQGVLRLRRRSRWPPPRWGRCTAPAARRHARWPSRCSAPASASRSSRTWTRWGTSPSSWTATPRPGRRYGVRGPAEEFRRTLLARAGLPQRGAEPRHAGREPARLHPHRRALRRCEDYTTSRVLTMEYVPGTKVTQLSPLARMEMDGSALAEELFRAYLKQILVDGFFHADPHPGNVFLTAGLPHRADRPGDGGARRAGACRSSCSSCCWR